MCRTNSDLYHMIRRDHKINEILDKLKIKPLTDYIEYYQTKGKEHVNRTNTGRILKQILYQQENKNQSDME